MGIDLFEFSIIEHTNEINVRIMEVIVDLSIREIIIIHISINYNFKNYFVIPHVIKTLISTINH